MACAEGECLRGRRLQPFSVEQEMPNRDKEEETVPQGWAEAGGIRVVGRC